MGKTKPKITNPIIDEGPIATTLRAKIKKQIPVVEAEIIESPHEQLKSSSNESSEDEVSYVEPQEIPIPKQDYCVLPSLNNTRSDTESEESSEGEVFQELGVPLSEDEIRICMSPTIVTTDDEDDANDITISELSNTKRSADKEMINDIRDSKKNSMRPY